MSVSEVIGQAMYPENSHWVHNLEQHLPPGPSAPNIAVPVQSSAPTMSAMDTELQTHLINEGVSVENINKLVSNGFVQWKVMKLLSENDIREIEIQPLGQQKLLWDIITQRREINRNILTPITAPRSGSENPQPSPPDTEATRKQLEELFRAIPSTAKDASPTTSTRNVMSKDNPLFHLLPPAKTKYHQIVKFIHVRGEEEEDEEEIFGEGKRKVVITGKKKTRKLHDVTPMQWCGANVKIMAELLREGTLNNTSIMDYLAYTAKIADLAEIYQWRSVLDYDDLYRQMQAQNDDRWGTESPHVHRICLRFKEKKATVQEKTALDKSTRLCINYQFNKCTRGVACKFRHICSAPSCGKSHPLAEHDKMQGNQ